MGGHLAISIKLKDRQQLILQEYFKDKYPSYTVPKSLHFIEWTNWITWIMHSPDLWLDSSEHPELQAKIEDQTTLKEIISHVLSESVKDGFGLQKYPNPYSYGIILYDFETGQILSSQGYSTPGNIYAASCSTACKEQYDLVRLATHANLINYIVVDPFDTAKFHEITNELKAKNVGFARTPNNGSKQQITEKEILYTNCSKADFDFADNHLFSRTVLIPSKEFKKICDSVVEQGNLEAPSVSSFLRGTMRQAQDPYGIFSSIHVKFLNNGKPFTVITTPEPCSEAEIRARLEKINEYLLVNNWPDTLKIPPLAEMPDPEATCDVESLYQPISISNQNIKPHE